MAPQRKSKKGMSEKVEEETLSPAFRTRQRRRPQQPSKSPESTTSQAASGNANSVLEENASSSKGKEKIEGDDGGNVLPYVELFLPDGRLVRQCRASCTCPKRFTFESRRDRMATHLLSMHGLDVDIPIRKGGRPVDAESRRYGAMLPNPNRATWEKQAKTRFGEKDRKAKTNALVQECRLKVRALELWNASGCKAGELTKSEFIVEFVQNGMAKYMSKKAARLHRIQKTIDDGYDLHVSLLTINVVNFNFSFINGV